MAKQPKQAVNETEPREWKPSSCKQCRFADMTKGKHGVIGKKFTPTTVYPCRRFPAEVLKEAADWCGEFKEWA